MKYKFFIKSESRITKKETSKTKSTIKTTPQIPIKISLRNCPKSLKGDLNPIKPTFPSNLSHHIRMLCSLGIPELLENIKKDLQSNPIESMLSSQPRP
jgi:hypothetical protein